MKIEKKINLITNGKEQIDVDKKKKTFFQPHHHSPNSYLYKQGFPLFPGLSMLTE